MRKRKLIIIIITENPVYDSTSSSRLSSWSPDA